MPFAHEPPDTTPPPPDDWGAGAAGCGAEAGGVDCAGGELCDGLGTGCGAWEGPCNPSESGLAAGGSFGTADDELRDPVADPPEVLATSVPAGDFEASDRPGATAETRAAKPAVSAAAPAMIHRRVRLTRASAASRASTARERS
ncbi:MAG TPA: hypothetical protein VLW51_07260 [Solirubrobacteraceae bacterium]|nr:hypothetical protein [Solirubrobacteraceae bacterium]